MDFFDENQDPTAPIPCLHEVFDGRRAVLLKGFIRPMEIKSRPFVKGEETFPKIATRERRTTEDLDNDEDIERLSSIVVDGSDDYSSGSDENYGANPGDLDGDVNPDGSDVLEGFDDDDENTGFTDDNYDGYYSRDNDGDGYDNISDTRREQTKKNDDGNSMKNGDNDNGEDDFIPIKRRRGNSWGETVGEREVVPEDISEMEDLEDEDIEIDLAKDKHFVANIGAVMNLSKREIAAGIKYEAKSEKEYVKKLCSSDFIISPWSTPEPINPNMYTPRPSITKSGVMVPLPPNEPPMNCITYRTGPQSNQQDNTDFADDSNEFY